MAQIRRGELGEHHAGEAVQEGSRQAFPPTPRGHGVLSGEEPEALVRRDALSDGRQVHLAPQKNDVKTKENHGKSSKSHGKTMKNLAKAMVFVVVSPRADGPAAHSSPPKWLEALS